MTVTIDLRLDCTKESCLELAHKEFDLLAKPTYSSGVSLMALPQDMRGYLATRRTFRKRAHRAETLGYEFDMIEPCFHYADYLAINRSAEFRQGRRMDDAYWNLKPTHSLMPRIECDLHHVAAYGVLKRGKVYAYTTIYRSGALVHLSQYLPHADHVDDGIGYLLMREVLRTYAEGAPGFFFYNRHDSGGEGLRWFKERLGLQKENVEWSV